MPISAKVLADSIAPCGARLTTMEWIYPRSIHSEIMTHRMLSKCSASSRAIPSEKLIQRVLTDPFIPEYIGANQRGMQAGEELSEGDRDKAIIAWLWARDQAVEAARNMISLKVHKQVVNRVIEPWMWITIVVSATEWDNVWGLRCHPAAEPHFQKLAYTARAALNASTPKVLKAGEWHLPLIFGLDAERENDIAAAFEMACAEHPEYAQALAHPTHVTDAKMQAVFRAVNEARDKILVKISVGRCARTSYLNHDGRRAIEEDIALHDRLVAQVPLHASPAEHVAQALDAPLRVGNFIGWRQYRKMLPNENIGRALP